MELINFIFFIFIFFMSRRNLFVFIYFVLFFLFCYSRYIIAFFYPEYILGGSEWVFPGVSKHSIESYSSFIFVFLLLSYFFLLSCRAVNPVELEVKGKAKTLFFLICFLTMIFLIIKSWILIRIILSDGYLASVDYQLPLWLSLGSSSFAKPVILCLILLTPFNMRSRYFMMAVMLMFFMGMSGQRKDLISILLFFICYYLSFKNLKYFKLIIGLGGILAISVVIFWFREDSYNLTGDILLELLWATGFSVNSGLFVIEKSIDFNFYDSLGFLNTYIYCGIGKLFSEICYSNERLNLAGFLLEKISAGLNFQSDTVFGGIGGNLIGSIFVGAGFSHLPYGIGLLNFIIISFVILFLVIYVFCYMPCGVTWALLVCCFLVSTRYAFDGMIPPLNQLLVAILLDVFFVFKKRIFVNKH